MSEERERAGSALEAQLNRRKLLVSGAAAAYGLSAVGRAFGATPSLSELMAASGTVTFGSNYSDPVPKKAIAAVMKKA